MSNCSSCARSNVLHWSLVFRVTFKGRFSDETEIFWTCLVGMAAFLFFGMVGSESTCLISTTEFKKFFPSNTSIIFRASSGESISTKAKTKSSPALLDFATKSKYLILARFSENTEEKCFKCTFNIFDRTFNVTRVRKSAANIVGFDVASQG